MAKDFIGYQALTDAALRGVVRDSLRKIEKSGLIGSHHFYLTFKTQFPGIAIPDFLREQYPDEMTIILQHQFWGLKVKEETFEVTLTFKKLPATLSIPFAALTAFFDPGVNFGLQFRGEQGGPAKPGAPAQLVSTPPQPPPEPKDKLRPEKVEKAVKAEVPQDEKPAPQPGEVVSLDSFRKK
jgi:hypothetical protein